MLRSINQQFNQFIKWFVRHSDRSYRWKIMTMEFFLQILIILLCCVAIRRKQRNNNKKNVYRLKEYIGINCINFGFLSGFFQVPFFPYCVHVFVMRHCYRCFWILSVRHLSLLAPTTTLRYLRETKPYSIQYWHSIFVSFIFVEYIVCARM